MGAMRLPSLSVLLLVTLTACDPTADAGKAAAAQGAGAGKVEAKGEAPKADAKADAPPPEASKIDEAKTNVTGDRKAFHDCLAGCDAEKASATDKATCRMNCEAAEPKAAAPAVPDADGGVGKALACVSACHDDAKATDKKACVGGCVSAGAAVPNAPAQAVLEQLGTCVGDCYGDKTLKPTDRETCKLTCSQVASSAGPADAKK